LFTAKPLDSITRGLAEGALDAEPESGVLLQRGVATGAGWSRGTTLAGKYRIEEQIGEGAMGTVLAATHLGLDERVAIKLIRPELRRDPFTVSRFAREAKALARIRSKHVVRVLDVGVSLPLGPYIVMEYLEGRDLASLLHAEGALHVRRAVAYVLQACEALAGAHAIGITHQDIKPGNLFLAREGQHEIVKVFDFGISRGALQGRVFGGNLALRRGATRLMGTPSYMSPEHLRDDPDVDHRSDIWSLGVVLHELVTGMALFVGESDADVCGHVLASNAASVSMSIGVAPAELRPIIARCLASDPATRYQDVNELARELSPLLRDDPPRRSQFESGEIVGAVRRRRRRSVVAGLFAVPVLAAGALAVATGLAWHSPSEIDRRAVATTALALEASRSPLASPASPPEQLTGAAASDEASVVSARAEPESPLERRKPRSKRASSRSTPTRQVLEPSPARANLHDAEGGSAQTEPLPGRAERARIRLVNPIDAKTP
jgi:eukaryotic-like serine/threonine-protein kinase